MNFISFKLAACNFVLQSSQPKTRFVLPDNILTLDSVDV